MLKKATLVKQLSDRLWLYRLEDTGSYVETYIFEANEHGTITNWSELPGSFRGGYDYEKALANLGYSENGVEPTPGTQATAEYVRAFVKWVATSPLALKVLRDTLKTLED